MEVMDAMKKFRAVRKYSSQKVSNEIIGNIIDAGRHSQSSRNVQPWRFLVVHEKETLKELSQMGKFSSHLAEASFGLAILTPDPSGNVSILFDAGQAAVYLQLAALEYGVGSCIVKMHHGYLAEKILKFPDDYKLNFMIAFGYSENNKDFEPKNKDRKSLSEISFIEIWGAPFQI